MADSTDSLLDIVYELTAIHGVRMEPAARQECRRIFDQTVGEFAREAERQGASSHPWDDEQFRSFILGQVKRIAERVTASAASGVVSDAAFREAANEVMIDTNKSCELAVERGKLKFITKKWTFDGRVCSMYMRSLGSS